MLIDNFLKKICLSNCEQGKASVSSLSNTYDVILHIGAPKTGTSALQAFCLSNRDALCHTGFLYPEHTLDMNGVSGGHSYLGGRLIRGDLIGAKECFTHWLTDARKQGLCLLLSAESFYGQQKNIRMLTEGLRVGVFAYFRDPVESIISNYNQTVKRHFATDTLQRYARRSLGSVSPGLTGEIFENWQTVFGPENVVVQPYAKSTFPDEEIEKSLISLLGIDASECVRFNFLQKKINASYSPAALELKRLFNHVLDQDKHEVNHRIDRCLQRYSDCSVEPRKTTEMLLGTDLYADFIDKFSMTNDRLKAKVFKYYPNDFLQYPEVKGHNVEFSAIPSIPLSQVVAEAFADDIDLIIEVKKQVSKRLESVSMHSYPVLKLAENLGFDVEEINLAQAVFLERQMAVLQAERSKPADLLRETALMLERCGQYDQAKAVIARALELRPNGPGIIAAYDRILNGLVKSD